MLFSIFSIFTLRLKHNHQGAILIIFAFALPIILGLVGLVVDGGRALYMGSKFEEAVKASAIACTAQDFPNTKDFQTFLQANFPYAETKSTLNLAQCRVKNLGNETYQYNAELRLPLLVVPNFKVTDRGPAITNSMTIRINFQVRKNQNTGEFVFVLSNNLPTAEVQGISTNLLPFLAKLVNSRHYIKRYVGVVPYGSGVALFPASWYHPNITGKPFVPAIYGNGSTLLDATNTYVGLTKPNGDFIGYTIYGDSPEPEFQNNYYVKGAPVTLQYPCPIFTVFNSDKTIAVTSNNINEINAAGYAGETPIPLVLLRRRNTVTSPTAPPGDPIPSKVYPLNYILRANNTNERSDNSPLNGAKWDIFQHHTNSLAHFEAPNSNVSYIAGYLLTMVQQADSNGANNRNQFPNLGMSWAKRLLSPKWRGLFYMPGSPGDTAVVPYNYNTKNHKKVVIFISGGGLTKVSSEWRASAYNPAPSAARRAAMDKLSTEEIWKMGVSSQCATQAYLTQSCDPALCPTSKPLECQTNRVAAYNSAKTNLQSIETSILNNTYISRYRSQEDPNRATLNAMAGYYIDAAGDLRTQLEYIPNWFPNWGWVYNKGCEYPDDLAHKTFLPFPLDMPHYCSSLAYTIAPICSGRCNDYTQHMYGNHTCDPLLPSNNFGSFLHALFTDAFYFALEPDWPYNPVTKKYMGNLKGFTGSLVLHLYSKLTLPYRQYQEQLVALSLNLNNNHAGAYGPVTETSIVPYIVEGTGHGNSRYTTSLPNALNQEFLKVCNELKSLNVEVFTINYKGGSASEQKLIQSCASNIPDHYHTANSPADLPAIMDKIFAQLDTPPAPTIIAKNVTW